MVTGGASGLGLATVEMLLQKNHCIIVIDTAEKPQNEGKSDLNLMYIKGDVSSEEDIKQAIDHILRVYGRIDNCVNCAGVIVAKPLLNFTSGQEEVHSLETWMHILNVNLTGTFNMCRLVAAAMAKNPADADGCRGTIINTSSVAAYDGIKSLVAYSASKAAVSGLTLPMAKDLAKFGIRVMAIAPGSFCTPLISRYNAMNSIIQSITFPKRLGHPKEFAQLVHSIIENPYLNGEVIRLDAAIRVHTINE